MERTRRIEKLFIQYTDELSANSETLFYQKEFNTYEYYNEENLKDCIEATITNCFAAENYLEQGYKYLNEYLKINNSFAIFGTVKDDPDIKKYDLGSPEYETKFFNSLKSGLINAAAGAGSQEEQNIVKIESEILSNVSNRANATVKFVEKVGGDVIVIMTDQDAELSGFFLGPYSQQVIHLSKVPVIAIKPLDLFVDEGGFPSTKTSGF